MVAKNKQVVCWNCRRQPACQGEGRFADGSWPDDRFLPKGARSKWFCSYLCYWQSLDHNKRKELAE